MAESEWKHGSPDSCPQDFLFFVFILAVPGLHCGLFVGAQGLSLVVASTRAFSVVVIGGLSCPEACGILVPRSGIKQMSLALELRFLTTGAPGKSLS